MHRGIHIGVTPSPGTRRWRVMEFKKAAAASLAALTFIMGGVACDAEDKADLREGVDDVGEGVEKGVNEIEEGVDENVDTDGKDD
jgi:hypothetical protein